MRTSNSIKNIVTGVLLQVITVFLGFISRKIFIDNMGLELLGINGLLTNILSMLSLVELGIGSAIYFSLYKPLAKKDNNQVHAIMHLYSKLYKYIGVVVAILGLIMLPFLRYFVNTDISQEYVKFIFLIFLTDSVISYFLAYRRNILSADQKNYVINELSAIFSVSISLIQIIVIITTKNYIAYLLIKVILIFIQNVIIYFVTNNRYPYLKNKEVEPLDKLTKEEIIKNAKALFFVNISIYCVFGTDNILLSAFAGVATVGIYSNYVLVINTINNLIGQVFNGIKASFGNFLVEEDIEKAHFLFNVLYFINFWVSTFCAISLAVLLNPFVELWLGKEMLFPIIAVFIIVFNFHSRSMTNAIELVRNSAGLYSPYPFFKYWELVEGGVNLLASIILAGTLKMGMLGVFLGTSISTFVTVFVLPWNVYKYVFKISSKTYYKKYIKYVSFALVMLVITYFLANFFVIENKIIGFILKCFICVCIPNILILISFKNTKEFKYLIDRFNVKKILEKVRLKRR
ncbi:oligosaccharide flippase family protein [Clostridium carnis]